jgi:hypothetical protein
MKHLIISICLLLICGTAIIAKNRSASPESAINSRITTNTVKLKGSFSTIDTKLPVKVYYAYAATSEAKIICPSGLINETNLTVKNGKLTIAAKDKINWSNTKDLGKIYIYAPAVNTFIGQCACDYIITCDYRGSDLNVELSGASSIKFSDIDCDVMNVTISGASEFKAGEVNARTFCAQCSGASDVNISELNTSITTLTCSGASEIKLSKATAINMTANASGASEIKISGQASNVSLAASGVSTIKAKGLQADTGAASASGMSEVSCNVVNCTTSATDGSKVKNK